MKDLSIQGSIFSAPCWINYTAVDRDGDCWGYEEEPTLGVQSWFPKFPFGGKIDFICHTSPEGWNNSLIRHFSCAFSNQPQR